MEIVDRVFEIKFGDAVGTAFSLDIESRQYLLTAKHVVQEIAGPTTIDLFHKGKWEKLPVALVGHSDVDVAVLAPTMQLTHKEMKLEAASGGFFVGQDVFFAGFPLGMTSQNVDSPFPAPLIKKAIISGSAGPGSKHPFYLDGHNNRGFSGGPVYLQIPGQPQFVVSMIISSYTAIHETVYDGSDRETELYVQQNSGIIQAYNICNALDLIANNPIGFRL